MSERISPPPFSHMVTGSSDAPVVGIPATARGRRFSPASSLTALLLLGAFGCSSAGSSFEGTGGSGQPPGSGGGGVATGGSGSGVGTGGSTTSGSGGTVEGTGGNTTTGTGGTGAGGTVAPTCPKGATAICHEFLANDNGRNQINYVNEFDPSKNWT